MYIFFRLKRQIKDVKFKTMSEFLIHISDHKQLEQQVRQFTQVLTYIYFHTG